MPSSRKPDLILKHDVKDVDGKTIRSVRIGAMLHGYGHCPGRIKIEYLPIGFDGFVTAWPAEREPRDEPKPE
jgi:hypothetical protein